MTKPRYQRIESALRERIDSGELRPGDRVPSEHQLEVEFGVSRMTARRAVAELSADGLVQRVRGSGTFVADRRPVSSISQIRDIADDVRLRGHLYQCRVLALSELEVNETLSRALVLPLGATLYVSELVHLEDTLPIQYELRHVAAERVPDYLDQDFTMITPSAYLAAVTPLTEARQTVEAVLPAPQVAAALNIRAGQPCLKILRSTYSRRGPISLAELIHPGHRYRLGNRVPG